jgi:hypothetical protein
MLIPTAISHQIDATTFDLEPDGALTIGYQNAGHCRSAVTLPPRTTLSLMMFFAFPHVATLIREVDVLRQMAAHHDALLFEHDGN